MSVPLCAVRMTVDAHPGNILRDTTDEYQGHIAPMAVTMVDRHGLVHDSGIEGLGIGSTADFIMHTRSSLCICAGLSLLTGVMPLLSRLATHLSIEASAAPSALSIMRADLATFGFTMVLVGMLQMTPFIPLVVLLLAGRSRVAIFIAWIVGFLFQTIVNAATWHQVYSGAGSSTDVIAIVTVVVPTLLLVAITYGVVGWFRRPPPSGASREYRANGL